MGGKANETNKKTKKKDWERREKRKRDLPKKFASENTGNGGRGFNNECLRKRAELLWGKKCLAPLRIGTQLGGILCPLKKKGWDTSSKKEGEVMWGTSSAREGNSGGDTKDGHTDKPKEFGGGNKGRSEKTTGKDFDAPCGGYWEGTKKANLSNQEEKLERGGNGQGTTRGGEDDIWGEKVTQGNAG